MDQKIYSIFKNGSKTFFTASLFFPKNIKKDVFVLYAFVRVADDLVDSIPQQSEEFHAFRNKYTKALGGTQANDTVIDSFIAVKQKYNFPDEWVEGFFKLHGHGYY
jgi:phytoene synthase